MDEYNLSEIERIQSEIEQDLQAAWQLDARSAPEAAPETAIAEAGTEAVTEMFTPFPSARAENFFHEVIKVENPPPRVRSWRRTVAVVCLACTLGTGSLGFGLASAWVYARRQWLADPAQAGGAAAGVVSTQYEYAFNDMLDGTLSDMIKGVEPSVVGVSASFATGGRSGLYQESTSEGSGIIFSEDDERVYIATNHHVVGGASSVSLSIADSAPIPAYSAGYDAEADLQVIFAQKRDLLAAGVNRFVLARFGDSDAMEVGDVVLAIGNAMGEGNSATRGIVSAKERTITIEGRSLTMLQTDAAINRGNSGGPLINTKGEVIGINTAKFSHDGYMSPSVEGMGYSISSNIAKPILEDLTSRTAKPALGIYGQTVTDELLEEMGLDIPPMGVLVSGVIKGSAAEKAGIERADIITGFNGRPVLTMEQLIGEIGQCAVGDSAEIKILRGGQHAQTLQVTLGEMNRDNF